MSPTNYEPDFCIGYCCSDFRNLSEGSHAAEIVPDLSNRIHPLFAREKFTNISNAEYDTLEMSLRLASRMLCDQRAFEFIVTTVDGSLHYDHPKNEEPGPERTWEEIDACEPDVENPTTRLLRYPRTADLARRADPAAHIRYRAIAILEHLTNVLEQIEIGELDVDGLTVIHSTGDIPLRSQSMFPRAGPAGMVLSRNKVCSSVSTADDELASLMNSYMTARVIIHEIGHLLNRTVNGSRKEEVFHGNSCFNEAGYALEDAIFGGIAGINNLAYSYTGHDIPGLVLVSVSYPNQRYGKLYGGIDSTIVQRWDLDEWVTSTRIPWTFIAMMFTDKFWTEQVPRIEGPIQPNRRCSYRWLIKVVQPGEVYTVWDQETEVTTKSNTIVTCSPFEPALPQRAARIFYEIVQEQDDRREAREAAQRESTETTQDV